MRCLTKVGGADVDVNGAFLGGRKGDTMGEGDFFRSFQPGAAGKDKGKLGREGYETDISAGTVSNEDLNRQCD